MRIAQVSPLIESVPPKKYGGTERIVSYLTEELVEQGHEVTLFASGDSITKARLISPWCCALRLQNNCIDYNAHHFTMLEMIQKRLHEFDIIHYHIDYLHFPLSRRNQSTPNITTLHGRLDIPDIQPLYQEYTDIPLVSISDSQRRPLPQVNWKKTILHGIPEEQFKPNFQEGKYLAFIGRFSPEKRADRAIQVAINAGIPIKLAAKLAKEEMDYFDSVIKPLLDHPLVEYVGEVTENVKEEFLSNAMAMLFLIDWPEPFGLVMIESMACGTPVIAWNWGSVPEVIDHGKTGFIVNTITQAEEAVKNLHLIKREEVRKVFEERFTSKRMVKDYLELYTDMIHVNDIGKLKYYNIGL